LHAFTVLREVLPLAFARQTPARLRLLAFGD
jgi:hypothetical protein